MTTHATIALHAMAFGGAAVGRLASGKVAFVSGGAPDEVVRARVVREHRSRVEAVIEEVLEPSPDRVDPPCPAASRCGGCPWIHLSVDAQRSWKRRLVAQELARAGLVSDPDEVPPPLAGSPLGSRTRTRLHRRGRAFGTMERRSRRVVPFGTCPVLAPELERFAAEMAVALAGLPPADADLELTVDAAGARGLLVLPASRSDSAILAGLPSALGVTAFRLGRRGRRDPVDEPELGSLLREESAGLPLAVEPGVFVQASREMNAALVSEAMGRAGSGRRFLEVYAGAGNLTVHLATRFDGGEACEADPAAARILRHNLSGRGGRVEVCLERDEATAERLASSPPPDLLIADPPRRGGIRALLPLVEAAPPARVVLVSCHPMEAVRDLASLARLGFGLESIQPVDLFPQTDHLELVAATRR